jgi:hypothetical protein
MKPIARLGDLHSCPKKVMAHPLSYQSRLIPMQAVDPLQLLEIALVAARSSSKVHQKCRLMVDLLPM